MLDLYDLEGLKKKLEKYEIEDKKEIYVFRGSRKYVVLSSIFFIVIAVIALYPFYKMVSGAEKLSIVKVVLSMLLIIYVVYAFNQLFKYKLIIKNNKIIIKNLEININDIVKAVVKIDKVTSSRYDRYLEITTIENRKIRLRLNIDGVLLFLKIIQDSIGSKLIFFN